MDLNYVKASTYDDPIKLFANQDYHKLKRECHTTGRLFEDPQFPANYSSLFFGGLAKVVGVEWRRPKVCSCPLSICSLCSYMLQ